MKKLLYAWSLFACMSLSAAGGTITLENDCIAASFDARTGSLIRLVGKRMGWKIMDRAVLGQSFEMLLPMEGREMTSEDLRYNVVKGVDQRAPEIERSGDKIVFTWRGMRTEHMSAEADITFRGEVRLTDTGLEFGGSLTNDSDYPVEYISWPCIGEVSVPDKSQPLYQSTRNDIQKLFPRFFNQHGYWGVDYPTSTYEFPERSFLSVNNRDKGFVFYGTDACPRYMVITSFELIPGFEERGVNPYVDEVDGEPVRIQFKANQVVYNKPGQKCELDPMRLDPYTGAWNVGVEIYRQNRGFETVDKVPQWLREPLTWQRVSVGSGAELARYAAESAELGVGVLQVRGWYRDTGVAITEAEGMAEGIAKCHQLGLRVVLETVWTQVNTRTQAYAGELGEYVMKDPFGLTYNRSYLCPLSDEVQQRAMRRWLELPAVRAADGCINTDHNHRDKTFFCFDERHGHQAGEPTANGVLELDSSMAGALRAAGKVAMGYGFLDQQLAFYDGYQLSVSESHFAKHRLLNPSVPIIAAMDVRRARRDMNLALMNRFNISYDLKFYNNRLGDYFNVTEYGRRIEALRRLYKDRLWNAAFADRKGGRAEGVNLAYSVFVAKDGKRAMVVANMDENNSSTARVTTDGGSSLMYASPESPDMKPCDGNVEIAPLSVVVIFEM